MELAIIKREEYEVVVLLDERMRIVKPVQNYLNHQMQLGRSINTVIANGRDLKLYWDFLSCKKYDYSKITPLIIGEFVEFLRSPEGMNEKIVALYSQSKRTGKTINRILSTVYCFYKYCCMVMEINNPIMMEEINRPQNMFKSMLHHTSKNNRIKKSVFKVKESESRITIIPEQHIKLMLETLLNKRDKLILKILYFTGARIGDVLQLKIENIPYANSEELFGVLRNIKSKGTNRDLFIPTRLIEEIDEYIIYERQKIKTKHSYIFVSLQKQNLGNPLSYRGVYEVFCRAKEKLGIKFTFHSVRHTFITQLAELGMDVSIISILAGHKHISTTERYTHLSEKYICEGLAEYWENTELLRDNHYDK